MFLKKDEIFKAMTLKKETVTLEDGEIIVSEIGAADLMDLYTRKSLHNEDGDIIMAKFTPALWP